MATVIDAHTHIFRDITWNPSGPKASPDSWIRQVRWFDQDIETARARYRQAIDDCWDPDGAKTIARMDQAGVDASVMMPMDRGVLLGDDKVLSIERKNEECYDLTQLWPGRLFSFCGVDPRRPQARQLLRRGLDEWGMLGLKLYPTTGFYPDDPIVYPLYELCAERGVPVLFHQGHSGGAFKSKYGHPMYVDSVAADFPKVPLILGHGGRIETWGREALSTAIYKTNIHIEISLWQHWTNPVELAKLFLWIRDRIGIDRLLFGSDMTNAEVSMSLKRWVDIVRGLPDWAKQEGGRLSQAEMDLVLGENAVRLFKLEHRLGC